MQRIERLETLFEGTSQPGVDELRQLLVELLDARGTFLEAAPLQLPNPRAYRLRFDSRSLIAKRLDPAIAQRNHLLLTRWLPAAELGHIGPKLLGVAAERGGRCVWHVYEDLGNCALNAQSTQWAHVQIVVELIARVHTRFAGHPLLPEVRLHGGDLGANFFTSNLRDAIRSLDALERCELSAEQRTLCERLAARLARLQREQSIRVEALEELGGPETLLHGDLWTTNTFVVPHAAGMQARLIDWDHAAVGHLTYDLSTFLMRFPPERRTLILEMFSEAVARVGWRLPPVADLNALFETAECARFANRIIWPAIALVQERADWAWDALAEVEQWFEDLKPVLLDQSEASTTIPTASVV